METEGAASASADTATDQADGDLIPWRARAEHDGNANATPGGAHPVDVCESRAMARTPMPRLNHALSPRMLACADNGTLSQLQLETDAVAPGGGGPCPEDGRPSSAARTSIAAVRVSSPAQPTPTAHTPSVSALPDAPVPPASTISPAPLSQAACPQRGGGAAPLRINAPAVSCAHRTRPAAASTARNDQRSASTPPSAPGHLTVTACSRACGYRPARRPTHPPYLLVVTTSSAGPLLVTTTSHHY